jgi:hypothetical protein
LIFNQSPSLEETVLGMTSASPFMGPALLSQATLGQGVPSRLWDTLVVWTLFWIIAYSGLAAGLLLATWATFDRCLGRMEEIRIVTPWSGSVRLGWQASRSIL